MTFYFVVTNLVLPLFGIYLVFSYFIRGREYYSQISGKYTRIHDTQSKVYGSVALGATAILIAKNFNII